MNAQNNKSEIKKKISEIEEKSADADYIYRGEPERYKDHPYCGKVSSGLWRECIRQTEDDQFDVEFIDIELVQIAILNTAKNYARESEPEFEMMAQLQHYGGKTNFIDFTTDYLRALFFACDGSPDRDGRIILLQKTEEIKNKYRIEEPRNPQNRVISQKSIFVRPPRGFIEPEQYTVIDLPKSLKGSMLNHLKKYHGISTETIYNDLHGFIKNQGIHQTAYIEFYRGLTYQQKGDSENDDTNEARVL